MFARFFLKKRLILLSFPSLPAMRLLLLVALCLACWHCQSPCEPPADQVAIIKFMDYNTKKALPDSIKFLVVKGIGSDSIIGKNVSVNSSFRVALSPAVDKVQYTFQYTSTKTYNLTIGYTKTAKIRSNNPDCGVAIDYSDLRLENHNTDSLVTVSSNIITDNATTPNFMLYIKP
jgi:hypothetical protein